MQRDASTPGSAGVAAVGANGGIAVAQPDATEASSTTVATTLAPVTSGPTLQLVTTPPSVTGPTTSTIPANQRRVGIATYKRYEGYGLANPCMAPAAPPNTTVTVRSLNTGRSISCLNVVRYVEQPDPTTVVVVNTDTFLQMADTRDAPVSVEISW